MKRHFVGSWNLILKHPKPPFSSFALCSGKSIVENDLGQQVLTCFSHCLKTHSSTANLHVLIASRVFGKSVVANDCSVFCGPLKTHFSTSNFNFLIVSHFLPLPPFFTFSQTTFSPTQPWIPACHCTLAVLSALSERQSTAS